MWTSNSGLPFNQPSKSSTKWALVMYRPGDGGGGETPPPPPPPGAARQRREGEPAVGGEEPLEWQLMLAVRRAIELGAYASAERGVAQRERESARQLFRGSGGGRGSGTGRSGARARRGSCTRGAIGTGEPAHEQGERRGCGQA